MLRILILEGLHWICGADASLCLHKGSLFILIFSFICMDFSFLLEYSCFAMLCQFLLSNRVNQLFSSVQSLSRVWLFVTPWTTARQASLSITAPGVYPNSCPSSWWCHPANSSSVIPFSSFPQSLPVSESFPMGQLFARTRYTVQEENKNT